MDSAHLCQSPWQEAEGLSEVHDTAGNVSASKVVGSVWSYDRQLLCPPFEALCSLDADALFPVYNCQVSTPSTHILSLQSHTVALDSTLSQNFVEHGSS